MSELQEVDLVLFSFSFYSHFQVISFSLCLAPRVRVSDDMGHIVQRRF